MTSNSLHVSAVGCDNCGAPLEVPEGVSRVTCAYCNERLKVHTECEAPYTLALDDVARKLTTIRRQDAIERADLEWIQKRRKYMMGGESAPTKTDGLLFLVYSTVFTLVWGAMAWGEGLFFLFGIVLCGAVIVGSILTFIMAVGYGWARARYVKKRRRLMIALNTQVRSTGLYSRN